MDEDDDFGEFGGFEVAEPVPVNVSAVQQAASEGIEASPSPWALLSTGASTVRPDLLCGENKFPQLLDPTVPVGPEGTNGAIPANSSSTEKESPNVTPMHFYANHGDTTQSVTEQVEDDANLANDILDGSFRSASHLDGETNSSYNSGCTDNPLSDQVVASGHSAETMVSVNRSIQEIADFSNSASHGFHSTHMDDNTSTSNTENTAFVADFSGNFGLENSEQKEGCSEESSVLGASVQVSLVHQDLSEDTKYETHLEQTVHSTQNMEQFCLAGNIPGQENQLSTVRNTNNTTQNDVIARERRELVKEVQNLREESKTAISLVVKEYKDLMLSNIQKQQETTEQHIKSCMLLQEEKFNKLLTEQVKQFEAKLKEEKEKMNKEKELALQAQSQSLQEGFDKFLADEQEKSKSALKAALEEERAESSKKMLKALQEGMERTTLLLKEQNEEFSKIMQEERQKSEDRMVKYLEVQREKLQEILHETVIQERKQGEMILRLAEAEAENRKTLALAVQQRQLTSLDVFLEGARKQLSLLMDTSHRDQSVVLNTEDENS